MVVDQTKTYGMTDKEIGLLTRYIENGMPGVTSVKDDQLEIILKMFMEGSTYAEMSQKIYVKKEIVLFLSYKNNWPEKRREHVEQLMETINSKIGVMKLESANFLLDVTNFLQKYFRDRMDTYNRTRDHNVIQNTDFKLLSHYLKCLDIMTTKRDDGNPPMEPSSTKEGTPNVSIFAADGSTVNLQDSKVSNIDQGALLKVLADIERAKEEEKNKK